MFKKISKRPNGYLVYYSEYYPMSLVRDEIEFWTQVNQLTKFYGRFELPDETKHPEHCGMWKYDGNEFFNLEICYKPISDKLNYEIFTFSQNFDGSKDKLVYSIDFYSGLNKCSYELKYNDGYYSGVNMPSLKAKTEYAFHNGQLIPLSDKVALKKLMYKRQLELEKENQRELETLIGNFRKLTHIDKMLDDVIIDSFTSDAANISCDSNTIRSISAPVSHDEKCQYYKSLLGQYDELRNTIYPELPKITSKCNCVFETSGRQRHIKDKKKNASDPDTYKVGLRKDDKCMICGYELTDTELSESQHSIHLKNSHPAVYNTLCVLKNKNKKIRWVYDEESTKRDRILFGSKELFISSKRAKIDNTLPPQQFQEVNNNSVNTNNMMPVDHHQQQPASVDCNENSNNDQDSELFLN